MTDLKFAIHQPNYLPAISFFYKMHLVDTFVLLDTVQIPRGQSFANRNRIKTPNGPFFLTVPLHIPKGQKGLVTYQDAQMAGENWKRKHLKSIEMNYKKAQHFDYAFPIVEAVIEKQNSFLAITVAFIESVRQHLNLATQTVMLSSLLQNFGQKNELIIDIGKAVKGNIYVSGTGGGQSYNDEKVLSEAGITLQYSDYNHPHYTQLWGDFEENLSVLDLLMNHGPDSESILKAAHA